MTTEHSPIFCANHPGTETMLRCNRCNKPICAKCAIKSPTGYRCPECVKGQQKIFDTATPADYVLGSVTAFILSGLASFLISMASMIGFFAWFIIIAAAPTAGIIIAEAVRNIIRRRRARPLFIAICVAAGLGAAPLLLINLISFNIFGLAFQGIYLFMAIPTVYTRLSGIQIFQ